MSEDTQWIAERAKCDMESFLVDFQNFVQENMDAMNAECGKRGWKPFSYIPERQRPPTFYLRRMAGQDPLPRCTFVYDCDRHLIDVTMTEPCRMATVSTRWDPATQKCYVVIQWDSSKEKEQAFPHADLGKAVASILEPFFFPEPK